MAAAFLIMAAVASPALAATSLAELDRVFKSNSIVEAVLHAREVPSFADLGGAHENPGLHGFLPRCASEGGAVIPALYEKGYRFEPEARELLGLVLKVGRRYADAGKALGAGYLPAEEYETGVGLPFVHPRLAADRKHDWAKPDLLYYVKKRGAQKYRLVGLGYISGPRRPPEGFKVSRQGSSKIVGQWRPWDNLCFRSAKGVVKYTDDAKSECAGGTFMEKSWYMHVWLPLHNPKGLFTPRNPVVDYLDLQQVDFPFCRG